MFVDEVINEMRLPLFELLVSWISSSQSEMCLGKGQGVITYSDGIIPHKGKDIQGSVDLYSLLGVQSVDEVVRRGRLRSF